MSQAAGVDVTEEDKQRHREAEKRLKEVSITFHSGTRASPLFHDNNRIGF
jgi:hypothetical protein